MRGWGSIFVFGDQEERESFIKEFLENNAEFATDILPDLKEPKKPLIGKPKTICDELVKDLKRSERKQVLDELMRQCEKLELKSLIYRAPRALSGGQRLRWSILFEAIMGKKCFLLRDDITIMDKNSADICENWLKNYVEDVRVVRVSQMGEDALPKNTLCYKLSGGEIDFCESFRRRCQLLKGLDVSVMQDIAENLPFTEGVDRLMYVLKSYGYKIAILSGGFTYFGEYIQKKYGIDYVYANELEVDETGHLTGNYVGEVVDGKRKAELLRLIAQVEKVDMEQTIAVGDGANDLPMLAAAGLGIAFHAKPRVVANARQSINTIGLDGVLYFLGFKDSYLDAKAQ